MSSQSQGKQCVNNKVQNGGVLTFRGSSRKILSHYFHVPRGIRTCNCMASSQNQKTALQGEISQRHKGSFLFYNYSFQEGTPLVLGWVKEGREEINN